MEAALRDQGHALFSMTAHDRVHIKGSQAVTLPAPDADGTYDAAFLDQCIADQWVPVAGRLTAR